MVLTLSSIVSVPNAEIKQKKVQAPYLEWLVVRTLEARLDKEGQRTASRLIFRRYGAYFVFYCFCAECRDQSDDLVLWGLLGALVFRMVGCLNSRSETRQGKQTQRITIDFLP
jgi:hypothetical protein